MEFVAEEILRQILRKLPTRYLARSCCVCRLWRTVIGDPSFRRLHANATHVTSGSGAETLLVSRETRRGRMDHDTVIHSVSSGKLMCRITDIAGSYAPTNACNGFLCLASYYTPDWPVYVCNPVTGDKLAVPPLPNMEGAASYHRSGRYAMGFSASTHEYKLFRLSTWSYSYEGGHYLDVYTLGGYGGWRRHPYKFPYRATHDLHSSRLPVLVDGKLYMLTERPRNSYTPDTILVIDVASEAHCTYPLPEQFSWRVTAAVHAFEMRGKLCVAIQVAGQRFIRFWVMPPLQAIGMPFSWEPCYAFYMDDDDGDKRRAAWFDDSDGTLCYRLEDLLYMYDTTKDEQQVQGYFFRNWDVRIQLPAVPRSESQQWNVYGGYRPSLVSPRVMLSSVTSSLTHHQDEEECFGHTLLHALRWQKSVKKSSPMCLPNRIDDERAAKRVHSSN